MRFSVLALDLATVTGWAVYSSGMSRPFSGHIKLPPNPEVVGPAALKLWEFLNDQHKMHRFTHIGFEAQHIAARPPKLDENGKKVSKGGIDINVIYKLIALGGITEMFAAAAGIHCYKVPIATWRKFFLGKGSGFNRAAAKQMCLSRCEQLGWDTLDDNAAEALGILDYFLDLLPGENRPWRDRTFMGAHKL